MIRSQHSQRLNVLTIHSWSETPGAFGCQLVIASTTSNQSYCSVIAEWLVTREPQPATNFKISFYTGASFEAWVLPEYIYSSSSLSSALLWLSYQILNKCVKSEAVAGLEASAYLSRPNSWSEAGSKVHHYIDIHFSSGAHRMVSAIYRAYHTLYLLHFTLNTPLNLAWHILYINICTPQLDYMSHLCNWLL